MTAVWISGFSRRPDRLPGIGTPVSVSNRSIWVNSSPDRSPPRAASTAAVRQLFGQEQISVGNALNYFVLGAKEDNSAPSPKAVAQAAAKPQFHIVEGTVTATLQKIAGWFYETDELLEDNAYLASALNNRGLYELDAAIEAYLLTTLQSKL